MQAAHLPTGPVSFPEIGDRDAGAGPVSTEGGGVSGTYPNRRIGQILLPDQSFPVYRHEALPACVESSDHVDAISQLVGREPAESLLAERKPAPPCPLQGRSLPRAMVVPRYEPDVSDGFQRHSVAVVFDDDRRIGAPDISQGDSDHPGVRIVGVLHQLEDGEPGRADELVAEELEEARARPERQVQRGTGDILVGAVQTQSGFTPSAWTGDSFRWSGGSG